MGLVGLVMFLVRFSLVSVEYYCGLLARLLARLLTLLLAVNIAVCLRVNLSR